MPITYSEIKETLRPYLLVHLPAEVHDYLTDADFLKIFNRIASEMNSFGKIHEERFYQLASDTTAEDAALTNYLLTGSIAKVYSLKVFQTSWRDQRYSYENDRLIFKTMGSGVQIDLRYLRKTRDMEVDADELDLPDTVIEEYLQLIKDRLRVDYGGVTNIDYQRNMIMAVNNIRAKVDERPLEEVRSTWLGLTGDQQKYDITDKYIGMENFVMDTNGDYYYVGTQ